MKSLSVTIQMKAIEQYFPVVLFIMLYKVVLTSESVNEFPQYEHSNKSSEKMGACQQHNETQTETPNWL